jgi:hypothetical protein
MIDGESSFEFAQDGKLRERLDFSQWVLDHMHRMTDVQAEPDLKAYEHMLNSLIFRLSPWWPKDKNEDGKTFEDRFEVARKKTHKDPRNPINRERLEDKELLLAELLDVTGIAFTRRKKARISGGLKRLWEEFPPFPPNKEE